MSGVKKEDGLALLVIIIFAMLMFWPVTVGGKTLLPADNFFAWEPWRSFASEQQVSVPHNSLLSDLVLENYAWKIFITRSIDAGELPLWNPHLFAGIPFLAAGQHSALYPFSLLFYVLPLPAAYGWFTALQFILAGASMYFFLRVLRSGRAGSLAGALAYMLSGFFVVSVVFSMVIAVAAWLPLALACVELIVRRGEDRDAGSRRSVIPWVALGALALGMQWLAGHIEITIYSLMVMAFYTLWRLAGSAWRLRRPAVVARSAGLVAGMVALGVGLGALQWIPMYELVSSSFRQSSASYAEIIGWAYPSRQIITFLIPDFFGNPSHHGYLDVLSRQWVTVTHNTAGAPTDTIFWGIKNYVEAGSYVGIVTLLFAAVAFLRRRRGVWFFALLAVVSLLFAFGTPLYGLLYYALPGFKQLHSPFRWVFPYTLSVAVLAGLGVDTLARELRAGLPVRSAAFRPSVREDGLKPALQTGSRCLGFAGLAGGAAGLITLLLSLAMPAPFVRVSQMIVDRWAGGAFADGRAFYSYQFVNFAIFFAFLAAGGALLLFRRRLATRLWQALAVGILGVELLILGAGFNPAVDPALLQFEPPAVAWLEAQRAGGDFRFTSYNDPDEKTFNSNAGMIYGLDDVRGYDSIISQQYVDYMNAIAPQAGELLYNRIAPIYAPNLAALDSRLIDLLNVRYVLTTADIPNAGFRQVYDGEVRVYENLDVLPRAFVVAQEEVLPRHELLRRLTAIEPSERLLLEAEPTSADAEALAAGRASAAFAPASVSYPSPNEALVDVNTDGAGWLVLADSYFAGWKAYVRPAGGAEADEQERQIYRAYGNFRAVRVDAGEQVVRFKYTPMSLKVGLFASFLAGVALFLALAYFVWGKMYREEREGEGATVRRVAKNSLTPMLLSLVNKGIDFAFAMLRLRILEPAGEGRYTFAIIFIGYFQILTLFGLGTLMTREVAKDKQGANRYFSNTTALRLGLWLLSLPLMILAAYVYYRLGQLSADTGIAIALFAVSIFFSNVSDTLSAVFYANEQMEFPAAVSTVTTVLKVAMGALVLLVGWGFVGLAGVSVVVNVITMLILFVIVRRRFFVPHAELEPGFQREMMRSSYPLMINHLLATVFFRIDMLLLKPMQGDAVVGYYSAAYKYIDGLGIIPAYFTMAIFPVMSRFAESARDSLMRAYVLSLRLLLIISIPIAAGTPFIAGELILFLGGGAFVPYSVLALQLLIWFLPFSYVNSVTQYVLIAVNQQRFLTRAFLIGVSFNIVANLIFIPIYGFAAAAVVTVLSELVLLGPFYYAIRRHLGHVPWLSIVWQPATASAAMAASLWLLRSSSLLLRVPVAAVVYLGVLVALGVFRNPDVQFVLRMLPTGRLGRLGRLLAAESKA